MSDNTLTISFPGNLRVDAQCGDRVLRTDQSVKNGGDASAPEPFDLFLASLGTCAGIYVLRFCQKRDIPTDGVSLTQTWRRDEKRKITGIDLEIHVPDDFPKKYHDALSRAAGQCAVKKVIEDPPPITARCVVD